MSKLSKLCANLGVLFVSVAIALVLCEFGARLVVNPSDVLSVEIVQDKILGGVPSLNARAGFDSWGFRNRAVPATADVVALGDSHTYGNTAKMDESWPYVMGRETGLQVYNMGMGGYGPNQYFYLLQTRGLSLKPKLVLVGLYMGDDFENAYSITYGLDHWAYLRMLQNQNVNSYIWEAPEKESWHKPIRLWLSRHSVIYQVAFHASAGARMKGDVEIKNAVQNYPGVASTLSLPEKHILEAFRPQDVLNGLDQSNPVILEGMRITFELLKSMDDMCRKDGVKFMVVIIPTKPAAFAQYVENNPKLPLSEVFNKLAVNENLARERTFKFLDDSHIPYVDTLPALQKSVEQNLYASSATDMHPGKNGYRVIGEAVAAAIKQGSN